jgi:hypothetical protein
MTLVPVDFDQLSQEMGLGPWEAAQLPSAWLELLTAVRHSREWRPFHWLAEHFPQAPHEPKTYLALAREAGLLPPRVRQLCRHLLARLKYRVRVRCEILEAASTERDDGDWPLQLADKLPGDLA